MGACICAFLLTGSTGFLQTYFFILLKINHTSSMTRQLFCFVAFLTGAAWSLNAQDPIFSQYYSTPLAINPAFAGTTYAPRISLSYRNQWPTVSDDGKNAYVTYAASYEQFIPAFNSGFGLMVLSDNSGGGLLKTTNVAASYGYRIDVNEDFHLKLGVEAGVRQTNVDWNRLVFLDQLDPISGAVDPFGNPNPTNEIRPDALTKTVFDVGAGMLAYSNKFYGGFALHHLTTPDEGFLETNSGLADGLPMRISVHGGAQFIVKEGNKRKPPAFVSPSILFVKQADQGQLNLGAYYNFGLVFAGSWYRHTFGNSDAVIAVFGMQYNVLKIGYSYDFTVSSLSATGGAHEVSLVINLDQSENIRRKRYAERYNDCFRIFR